MEPHYPWQVILHCFDPLGREVIARLGQWRDHIEDGHPEMNEHFASVQQTIERPEQINIDANYSNRKNFYRHGVLPAPYDRVYLKVCVAYGPGNALGTFLRGEVITAYPTRRIGRREVQQWP